MFFCLLNRFFNVNDGACGLGKLGLKRADDQQGDLWCQQGTLAGWLAGRLCYVPWDEYSSSSYDPIALSDGSVVVYIRLEGLCWLLVLSVVENGLFL